MEVEEALGINRRTYALVTWRKAGPLRFLGHLDVARTFDRAVRRARLPVVYSRGFSPSAHLSFADALPVGVAGDNELCLIELERPMSAVAVHAALAPQMPTGLEVADVRVLREQEGKLLSQLSRAEYEIELRPSAEVPTEALREAIRLVREAGDLPVVRETKRHRRELDIRPHIYALHMTGPDPEDAAVRIRMSLGFGQDRLVKPTEVLACLARQVGALTGKQIQIQPRLIRRLGVH